MQLCRWSVAIWWQRQARNTRGEFFSGVWSKNKVELRAICVSNRNLTVQRRWQQKYQSWQDGCGSQNMWSCTQVQALALPQEFLISGTVLCWFIFSQHVWVLIYVNFCCYRGPKGVWTLEKKGLKPQINVSFDDAEPTFTHMAIVALAKSEKVQYVVSQNIDGLHLKSGLERSKLSELHGNMFIGQCSLCSRCVLSTKCYCLVEKLSLSC